MPDENTLILSAGSAIHRTFNEFGIVLDMDCR